MMFCFAPSNAQLLNYKVVPDFSFPDPQALSTETATKEDQDPKQDRETFTFVLTESDSRRLYAFCRRYTPSDASGSKRPEVACIITRFCWYDIFSSILDAVEETACGKNGALGVAALARRLKDAGLPAPGRSVHVPVEGIHPSRRTVRISRPANSSSCTYDRRICALFRCMPVSKAVMLFFLLLTERRVILMSARPSVLSDCVHALHSLLYPFQWQHIYTPILIRKMLDYVCAPMPFIIGIHISMLSDLKRMPMEEVVMVDLDRGRLRYNEKVPATNRRAHTPAMIIACERNDLCSQGWPEHSRQRGPGCGLRCGEEVPAREQC